MVLWKMTCTKACKHVPEGIASRSNSRTRCLFLPTNYCAESTKTHHEKKAFFLWNSVNLTRASTSGMSISMWRSSFLRVKSGWGSVSTTNTRSPALWPIASSATWKKSKKHVITIENANNLSQTRARFRLKDTQTINSNNNNNNKKAKNKRAYI